MSEAIYKSLFENSVSVMLILHPDTGRIIDANKAACNYYGYKKNELKKMAIQDINALSKNEIFKEFKNAKNENRKFFQFRHRIASGDIKDVEVFSNLITIGNEKILFTIVHDISQRKHIEQQIRIEKNFSESLISSLPGVMYVFDQMGRFKRWNKNFERVTGYSEDQIKMMNPLDFIATKDKQNVRQTIETVFAKGKADVEGGLSTAGGKVIPYLFTGYRFAQENLNYLVGVGLDISDRVKTEKEKENLIIKLQETLSEVKQLSGLLPICASCKNIRDDKGYWKQIESYIKDHSEAEFSHGICPDCAKKLYPELNLKFMED